MLKAAAQSGTDPHLALLNLCNRDHLDNVLKLKHAEKQFYFILFYFLDLFC